MSKSNAYCCVDGCRNNSSNKKLSFFKLPKDEDRYKKWLRVIGRPDLMNRDNLKPQCYVICAIHFEDNMIFQTPRLHPNAIPTKHLPSEPILSDGPPLISTMDASTQTTCPQKDIVSIRNRKNATTGSMSVQTRDENVEQIQTSASLSKNIPRKRKRGNNLKQSVQKIKVQKGKYKKIKEEIIVEGDEVSEQIENNLKDSGPPKHDPLEIFKKIKTEVSSEDDEVSEQLQNNLKHSRQMLDDQKGKLKKIKEEYSSEDD